jgi:radical SAM protein with 4Fe4S-binding SPASM domain
MLNNFDITNLPKNFCSVPWLQIHTEPDGVVHPCCYFIKTHQIGNWRNNSIKEIYHGSAWNALRKQLLDNEQPLGCSKCYQEEKIGLDSPRTRFNTMYQSSFAVDFKQHNKFVDIVNNSNDDGSVTDSLKLSTVDLIFNNLCNYKCRSCSPEYSTNWYADAIKLAEIKKVPPPSFSILQDNSQLEHLDQDLQYLANLIDHNSEVHFTGGEPMMQVEHYRFLTLLIAAGKTEVRIRYNTNLSVHRLNDVDVFDLLAQFTNVMIVGSIDAIGKPGEYIRHGFDWDIAMTWLDEAKEKLPHAGFGVNLVYSILNSFSAIDVHRFFLDHPKFSKFGFYLNTLHGPDWLKVTSLPPAVKAEAAEKIKEHIAYMYTLLQTQTRKTSAVHWHNALTFLNSADDSDRIHEFFKNTTMLDQLRNEDFKATFPELYEKLKPYDH